MCSPFHSIVQYCSLFLSLRWAVLSLSVSLPVCARRKDSRISLENSGAIGSRGENTPNISLCRLMNRLYFINCVAKLAIYIIRTKKIRNYLGIGQEKAPQETHLKAKGISSCRITSQMVFPNLTRRVLCFVMKNKLLCHEQAIALSRQSKEHDTSNQQTPQVRIRLLTCGVTFFEIILWIMLRN